MIIGTGCFPKILEYAMIRKSHIQVPSLRIIGNLASGEDNKLIQALVNDNAIITLENLLSTKLEKQIKEDILWALNNFSDSSINIINHMIENEKLNKHLFEIITQNNMQSVNIY